MFFAAAVIFVSIGVSFAQTINWQAGAATEKITAEELKSLVAQSKNKQPVLINFWATWCGPCRAEFPDLVKIDLDYRAKGLNFALISVDNIGFIDAQVPEFLRQYEATMPSYLIDAPNRRQIARAVRRIAPTFRDAYPTTLLFDRNGKLVYQKVGVINPKILRAQIDKVLQQTKPK